MIKKLFVMQVLIVFIFIKDHKCSFADWGERCFSSAECIDHRMVCEPDQKNITKCICDRFHEWNGSNYGCIQVFSTEEIINKTVKVSDNEAILARNQSLIIKGPLFSAVFLLLVGFVCGVSVFAYCLHMRRSDRQMKVSLEELRTKKHEHNRSTTPLPPFPIPSKPMRIHSTKSSPFV